MVIPDYWVRGDNSLRGLAIRTGCDSYLCMYVPAMWSVDDYDSPTARTAMSPWMKILITVDAVLALLLAGGVAWIVLRTKQEKAHPELFKRKVSKARK